MESTANQDISMIVIIFATISVCIGIFAIIYSIKYICKTKRYVLGSQNYGSRNEECIIIPKIITGDHKTAQSYAKNITERLDYEHITSPRDLVDKLAYSLNFVIESFKVDKILKDDLRKMEVRKKAVDTA